MADVATPQLTCRGCGERLVPSRRRPGALTHVSRVVAACDLDADHAAEPDLTLLGTPPCTACGAPTTWAGGAFVHVDPIVNHPASPTLPT